MKKKQKKSEKKKTKITRKNRKSEKMKKIEKIENWVVSRCFGWAFEVCVGPMLGPLVTHTAVHKGFWEGKNITNRKDFVWGYV